MRRAFLWIGCVWLACGAVGAGAKPTIAGIFVRPDTGANALTCEVTLLNSGANARRVTLTTDFSPATAGAKWRYPPVAPQQGILLAPGERKRLTLGPVKWTPGRASWWWPNVPFRSDYRAQLHNLNLRLWDTPRWPPDTGRPLLPVQKQTTRFGFATPENGKQSCALNGVPFNIRGVGLSEMQLGKDAFTRLPGFRPPSKTNPGWPAAVRNFQRLNVNGLLFPDMPPTQYMLEVCDALGMPVITGTALVSSWPRFAPVAFPKQSSEPEDASGAGIAAAENSIILAEKGNAPRAAVQLALRARGLRGIPQSLVKLDALLDIWPGVIPGLRPDDLPEAARSPTTPDTKKRATLAPPKPWNDLHIRLMQQSFAPVAVYDKAYDLENTLSNGRGQWPAVAPFLPAGRESTRLLNLCNDEFTPGKVSVKAEFAMVRPGEKPVPLPNAAPVIRREMKPGQVAQVPLRFRAPKVEENTTLLVTYQVTKDDRVRYRETHIFTLLPDRPNAAYARDFSRDDAIQGDWAGKVGREAFLIPIRQGVSASQLPHIRIGRGAGFGPRAPEKFNPFQERDEHQEHMIAWEEGSVTDARVPLRGPGLSERVPVAFAAEDGPLTLRVEAKDGKEHLLSLYLLDYRRENLAVDVDIFDRAGNRIESRSVENFGEGALLRYRFAGTLILQITSLTGKEPTLSGVFIDPVPQ